MSSAVVALPPAMSDVAGGAALRQADRDKVVPVRPGLAELLPWGGLRRGSTVVVRGSTTVLLALLAEATANGSWAAVVGVPALGVLAAFELGVAVDRLALVPRPGGELGAVVAALLDGMAVVAVRGTIAPELARRLSARARHRGAVLLPLDDWPGADLELSCTGRRWSGPDQGYGHLRTGELIVHARGRGAAARPVRTVLTLPGLAG